LQELRINLKYGYAARVIRHSLLRVELEVAETNPTWEIRRLCRGGSRCLTVPGVCTYRALGCEKAPLRPAT
jgi:hypothetical protein